MEELRDLMGAVMDAGLPRRVAEVAGLGLLRKRQGVPEARVLLQLQQIVSAYTWLAKNWEADVETLKRIGLWPYSDAEGPVQEP
jgi:hypothetical protein